MITLRHIIYHSSDDPDNVFGKLSRSTQRKENLSWELFFNTKSNDTDSKWIGVCNRKEMKFKVTEPVKFLSPWWLQVIIQGEIVGADDKVIVNVRLKPTFFALLFWSIVYVSVGVMVGEYLLFGSDDPTNVLLALIFGPVLGTILIVIKLNSVETDLEDTIGIR